MNKVAMYEDMIYKEAASLAETIFTKENPSYSPEARGELEKIIQERDSGNSSLTDSDLNEKVYESALRSNPRVARLAGLGGLFGGITGAPFGAAAADFKGKSLGKGALKGSLVGAAGLGALGLYGDYVGNKKMKALAEKKASEYEEAIYKEAEFKMMTRMNKEYLDAGGRTPLQTAKETLPGIAIGTGAGMIAGNVIGKKLGGRAGQEIGTLTGLAFGGLPTHIKSSLKDKEVMRNMLKKRHPEMSDDELKKATNKAMWGFWPDAKK